MDGLYSREQRREVFGRILRAGGKRELAEVLADELGRLTIPDLQRISEAVEREVGRVPSPYKEKIHPYFMEQLFGGYFKLMRMRGDGSLEGLGGGLTDKKLFEDFCRMAAERSEEDGEMQYGGYYYLVSCFVMFVLDEPGHPAGMPFPGGFVVEHRGDGAYYCPIRDKEKDVPFALCNYCPAKQSEMP